MSIIINGAGYLFGVGFGACIPIIVNEHALDHVPPSSKKLASLAVHTFALIAATALYVAIPQLHLGFFITRILQGALPLAILLNGLATEKKYRDETHLEHEKWFETTVLPGLCIGVPAFYFGLPLITTLGIVTLIRHGYDIYQGM